MVQPCCFVFLEIIDYYLALYEFFITLNIFFGKTLYDMKNIAFNTKTYSKLDAHFQY